MSDEETGRAPAPQADANAERTAAEPPVPARIALGSSRSPDEPAWTRLLAPLRSEDAAFRALLIVAAVCGTVAAVVVLVRALT